ncbi:hypothetical protein [Enterobacter phage vB_ExiM_F5M1E]|nr:hypothetical protein [Enterobacter phage vB_ExiM_F1M1E]UNA03069.1 hypothetical protein [Enterobacter phage vB_ExiM_F2M1E]UNA03390.1 hypothetical protein [Enterobacter phage vB_ExiM_F4M1E]UNA03711.1 hypothetical protein [Enterobacter phage vB_ExiM_F5M1E]UNA04031.1 hypothetical protein [Pantoea phage vB_PdiM_F5M2A]
MIWDGAADRNPDLISFSDLLTSVSNRLTCGQYLMHHKCYIKGLMHH